MTGLWGHGTETRAAVNLTITSNLDINFSDDTADFGEGYIVSGFDSCTIGTDGTNSSGCFNFSLPNGFILENIGNRYAAINLTNTNFTNSLLGGTASGYAWMWNDPENDAEDSTCDVAGKSDDIPVEDTWLNLTVANAPYTTAADNWCVKFNYTDSNDIINISIKFHIDQTALARVVSDTWLVTALDAGQ